MANQINENNVAEFIGQIIDGIEDMLDAKGILPADLPNDERDDDPDNPAIIYGTDYGSIQEVIEELLNEHGLVSTGVSIIGEGLQRNIVNHIIGDGVMPVLNKIEEFELTEAENAELRHYIDMAFRNWEVFQ